MKDKNEKNHIRDLLDEGYPKPICLELVDLTEAEGQEKEVLETLKSFSNKIINRSRHIHDLKETGYEKKFFKEFKAGKRTYKFKTIWSIDINGRKSKQRMIYALDDERNVIKILSFSHDNHKSR